LEIAFVLGQFPKNSETFIQNQIKALIQEDHQVDIYAARRVEEEKTNEIVESYSLDENTVYFEPPSNVLEALKETPQDFLNLLKQGVGIGDLLPILMSGRYTPRKLKALRDFNHREDYDIIHYHFGNVANDYIEISEIHEITSVASFYGYDVTGRVHPDNYNLYEELWDSLDGSIAISQHIRSKMITLGCTEEYSEVINLGIDPKKFDTCINSQQSKSLEVVSIARHVEKKGLKYGIRAISRLEDEERSKINYRIGGDGPLRDELEKLVEKEGLEDVIEFVGWLDQQEVSKLMGEADIFLQPSITASDGDMEGQCLTLQEAQAKGTPVISTYHNGIPEGVIESETGFLTPERDSGAIASFLKRFISQKSLVEEMGRKSRKNIVENFDYRKKAKEQIKYYESLIND
jgi:colanic acid/amylovoran biosynthesis glycosyltransferase